jgi:hypothetical protein
MVMMFVGEVVSVVDRISVLFLLYKSYGVGVFVPAGTLRVVNSLSAMDGCDRPLKN